MLADEADEGPVLGVERRVAIEPGDKEPVGPLVGRLKDGQHQRLRRRLVPVAGGQRTQALRVEGE